MGEKHNKDNGHIVLRESVATPAANGLSGNVNGATRISRKYLIFSAIKEQFLFTILLKDKEKAKLSLFNVHNTIIQVKQSS